MLICAALSAAILVATRNLLVFGIFIFITGLMDGVDGAIARLTNRQSKFGGFFDSTMDRVSEGIIYTALLIVEAVVLVFGSTINILLIGLSLIFSFLISYTRARLDLALAGQLKVDSNIGFLGRSERLFFLFILSVISFFSSTLVFSWGFVLYTISVIGTALFRIIYYKDYLTRDEME
jgi:phosphatidylglycerophosphate synthase